MKNRTKLIAILAVLIVGSISAIKKPKHTLYIIGDSTVKAGGGNGEQSMWGWGSVVDSYFNKKKLAIENHAIGGRSSRTFLTDGRWEPLLAKMQAGDFLIMQFGHNDDWAINDTIRARGTIKGIGEEMEEIDNLITKKHEVVHSYGWYLRKYISEAQAKGVQVMVCSPVARNNFDDNARIKRPEEYYPKWARQVAEQTGACFIDLHEYIASEYDKLGQAEVKERYFTPKDNTHTSLDGALLNARMVLRGVENCDNKLKKYIK